MLEHVLSPLRNARTVLKHYTLSFGKTVVWSRMAQRTQTVNFPTLSSPAQGRSRTRRRTLLRSISGSRASTTCTAPSRHHRWVILPRNGWVVDIAVHALHSCRESCGTAALESIADVRSLGCTSITDRRIGRFCTPSHSIKLLCLSARAAMADAVPRFSSTLS